MEFRVLGSVEAVEGNSTVSLGGPQQRKLLAVLLSNPGRTLSSEALLEVLWPGGDLPENARRTSISYVSRLRGALGEGWIATTESGYSLDVAEASVDALRFTDLVASARDLSPDRAVDVLDEALALWRGPVFGDLHQEWWALPMASRLDELHLAALAQRIDALAVNGWDARALSEVHSLVALHPLRSQFVERLMRALDACGRTDEALRAFQRHREMLIDRTGLDPSAELIALDRSIAERGQQSVPTDTQSRPLRGYVLRDVIGEGSFGTVYRAVQPLLGREVAVKVVRRELADDRSFIQHFEAEARLVARLEHPHIVPLYDFWREPGGAYLVFRLLRGGTAEQTLTFDNAFSLQHATMVVEQIGSALSVAHSAGIVHRDVKPANIMFDDDGQAYLTDFGIATQALDAAAHAALKRSESSPTRLSAGSPMYASPEQARDHSADARADQYALAATMWELLTGHAPFDGLTAAEIMTSKLRAPLVSLRSHRADLPARLDDALQRATSVHPDDRFETVDEFVRAWQSAVALGPLTITAPTSEPVSSRSVAAAGATIQTLSGLIVNPFKGLRPFGEEDFAEFFGRTALLEALRAMVARQRFTAVVGPSGSGKSSLVLAGLIPFEKREGSLVVSLTPGDDPFASAAAAFTEVATADQSHLLAHDAFRTPSGFTNAAIALAAASQLIVVVDQLEELWTATAAGERSGFAAALAELERCDADVRVVATVRADWFDRPLRDASLGPLVARGTFGITPMVATELYEAIVEPAAKVGVRFESGLAGRIIAEALDQPASLPLLQFALTELFDRREGSTVTMRAYDEIGGLSGSIAHQAESWYEMLSQPDQAAVRRLFARLVTVGDGSEDTRRRARRSELVGVPDRIIDALLERRLLTVDRDRDSREPMIEVAHEALLRSWPRLRDWLEEDRDWVRELRGLASATRLWESSGRDDADLYRGARLAVVDEMIPDRTDALTPNETSFVVASRRLADAERLAAEERSRVRERQNRRLRRSMVGLGVVLIIALIASALAVTQRRRADVQTRNANHQASLAADQSRSAEASAAAARQAENDSAFQNLIDTSLLERTNHNDLAALLAVEASRIDPNRAASALFSTFTRNVGFVGYRSIAGAAALIATAALSDGTVLAVLDGGRLVQLNLDTGVIVKTFDTLDASDTIRADFGTFLRVSGDGRMAAYSVPKKHSLEWRAFDIASGNPLTAAVTVPYDDPPSGASADPTMYEGFGDAALNQDGSLLAISGGPQGHVLVYRTSDGSLVGDLFVPPPAVGWAGWLIANRTASVVFDGTGLLYVGDPDGHILIVDPARAIGGALSEQRRISATERAVDGSLHLVDMADGSKMLLTSGSGKLSLVSLADGHTKWATRAGSVNTLTGLPTPFDGLNPCRSMAVAATSELFYCADDVGTITERGLEDGALTARTFDRQAGITGTIAITADGHELVAGSYTNNSLATWRLDGSGPVQRLIATRDGSSATGGYNRDGSMIASARWKDVTHGSFVDVESGTPTEITGLFIGWAADPDEAWMTMNGVTAERYDLTTQTQLAGPGIPLENATLSFVNDVAHQRIYMVYPDSVRAYDEVGQPVGATITSAKPGATINSAFGTPDGEHIVVSYWDGTRLYESNTGVRSDAPDLPVISSTISQNGIAAGTTADGRIYLFDPNTLEISAELPASHGYAVTMWFSDDGSRLVVGNTTDGERVYDVRSRTLLGDAIPIDRGVFSFLSSISPDGQQLAIPVGRLGVALWDLNQAHWPDAACKVAGRSLTQAEWDRYLGRWGAYHQTCVDGQANP